MLDTSVSARIIFASDLHGSLGACERLLEIFVVQRADWLVLLGDLLNHGPRNPLPVDYAPAKVASLLNHYAGKIIAVQGNCDSEVDQMLLNFPLMAPWQNLLINATRYFVTHGHHFSPEHLPILDSNDVFIYGHTHIPQLERIADIYHFNPGSTTFPKAGHKPTYGILEKNTLKICGLYDSCLITSLNLSHSTS